MKSKRIVNGCLLVTVLTVMTTFSCCDNDDDCTGATATSAEFRAYTEVSYYEREDGKVIQKVQTFEEDTFLVETYITFEALDSTAASYEWSINDRKWTTRKFSLFINDPGGELQSPVEVKLKVTKTPNSKCFPDDDGVDSVSQLIYTLRKTQWPLIGEYQGYEDSNPNNIFTVEIYDTNIGSTFVSNIPSGCNNDGRNVEMSYYTAFNFGLDDIVAPELDCYFRQYDFKHGYLEEDRKNIFIEYEFTQGGTDDSQLKRRIFKGTKIP